MERRAELCEKCALYGSACVFRSRSFTENVEPPIILFVGEAPGKSEVLNDEVFSGESGNFLIELLKENDLLHHSILTNAVRCQPPSPRTLHWWDNTAILCDRYLHEEIRRVNPDLIVALGEAALHYICGRKKKKIALGKQAPVNIPNFRPINVFVTYNPAHIFHRADRRVEENFKEHIRRIGEIVHARAKTSDVFGKINEYLVYSDYDRELEYLLMLIKERQKKDKVKRLAIDIEVGAPVNIPYHDVGKSPTSEILLVGVGTDNLYRGFVFYDTDKRELIGDITKWDAMRKLLTSGEFRIYMHNASFEIGWFLRKLNVYPVRFVDTMALAHVLNENLPSYSLEMLIKTYRIEAPSWKEWVGDSENYAKIPLTTLATYNYYDVQTTFRLGEKLIAELMGIEHRHIKEKLISFVSKVLPKIVTVVAHMTATGIPASMEKQLEVRKEIEDESERLYHELRNYAPAVQNFLSTPQVYEFLKSIGVHEVENFKTAKGNPSLTKSVIEQLIEMRPDVEFLKLLLDYRESVKLLSTYVASLAEYVHPVTGRIYPNIHITGTKTGRLSTSSPPLQNYPTERVYLGKLVRKVFAVPDDYAFITCDAKQHELRVLAALSGDENLRAAFLSGSDVHTYNASLILGKPVEEITPEERQIGKKLSFAVVYGVTPEGAVDIFKLRSVEEARALLKSIKETFPDAIGYIEKNQRSVLEYPHIVVGFLGRARRPLPDVTIKRGRIREDNPAIQRAMRQAGNFVIQSVASDLWCLVAYHIFEKLHALGLDKGLFPAANICLLIHDSIYIVCKKVLIDTILEIIKGAIAFVSKEYFKSEDLPITAEYAIYYDNLGSEPVREGEWSIEEIKEAIREKLWEKNYEIDPQAFEQPQLKVENTTPTEESNAQEKEEKPILQLSLF